MSYTNPWLFQNKPFLEEHIEDNFGFVYCIKNKQSQKLYIGRKYFWSLRKTKKSKKRVRSMSDWQSYYGSSKELLKDVLCLGEEAFERTILSLHKTKGQVNFHEIREQFVRNVLEEKVDNGEFLYYNENILSRYFRKK